MAQVCGLEPALAADRPPPSASCDQATTAVGEVLENRVLAGSCLNAILQRDVRDIAALDKLRSLPQLLTALARVCGQLCNDTQLGTRLGLDGKTVNRVVSVADRQHGGQSQVRMRVARRQQKLVRDQKRMSLDTAITLTPDNPRRFCARLRARPAAEKF